MTKGYPDWLRAFLLLGKYGATYLPVLLDASGNLYAVFKGDKGGGDLVNIKVDADGQLIMIPRGANGNYLVVDASGFLTTVIKGAYGGDLRTVKLDDQGRLSAFVIDTQDAWGQMLQVGNAELAARLGSPLSYDRRGQLLFSECFENGRSLWGFDYGGTGAGVSLDPTYHTAGGYSLKMVAGSEVGGFASVEYIRGLFPGLRVGLGLHFSVLNAPSAIDITLGHYDGTTHLEATLRYILSTTTIQLKSSLGWVNLATFAKIVAGVKTFNYIKIVADFSTGYYDHVLLNEFEYLALAAPLFSASAPDIGPSIVIDLKVTRGTAAGDAIYVDDIALTTQEP